MGSLVSLQSSEVIPIIPTFMTLIVRKRVCVRVGCNHIETYKQHSVCYSQSDNLLPTCISRIDYLEDHPT